MNLAKKAIEIKHILERVNSGMVEISPLITKKLIEEFEATGVSPVFSKEGKITEFKFVEIDSDTVLVLHNNWKILRNNIEQCEYSVDDFWFLLYDQSKYTDEACSLLDKLLVVSKKSGKSREYDVGLGSTFPDDLIFDIKNKFF